MDQRKPILRPVQTLLESRDAQTVLERRLAEYALGIVAALRGGAVSIEQAEADLFNLDNLRLIRSHQLQPALGELIEWGMELEDVADAAPDGLPQSLDAMTKLAEQIIARAAA